MVKQHFPEKTITVTSFDKPYMTEELKQIRRRRQRVYRREGKSQKYIELKKEFDSKLKAQSFKYQQKIAEKVAQGSISNTYRALRKLEFGGSVTQSSFDLPSYHLGFSRI